MREIRVHLAQPICEPVEPVTIQIATTFPDLDDPDEARLEHERDAAAIGDALWQSLPGGTIDQLIAWMLLKSASRLRVRFPKEPS